jgi:hypothetical protein
VPAKQPAVDAAAVVAAVEQVAQLGTVVGAFAAAELGLVDIVPLHAA